MIFNSASNGPWYATIRRGHERLDATRLPLPTRLLEPKRQRFDTVADRLPLATKTLVERRRAKLDALSAGLISPKQIVLEKQANLQTLSTRLGAGLSKAASKKRVEFTRAASRLRPEPLIADARRARNSLVDTARRARPALDRVLRAKQQDLTAQTKLLETLSYQATLKRGYAIVKDDTGKVLRSANAVAQALNVTLTLSDGDVSATPNGQSATKPETKPKPAVTKKKTESPEGSDQGSLF